MISLIGYTGFVGGNIYASSDNMIDGIYNSKNIEEAYGTNPDLLIYAGLRAEKYLANSAPEKDYKLILQAEDNITRINPRKLVLISTIDVFGCPSGVDEHTPVDTDGLHAYGYNRYALELWVRERYPNSLIIRLPGLYGRNIKKNFIYDVINVIPYMLSRDKYEELLCRDDELGMYYKFQENGFYKVSVSDTARNYLKEKFLKLGFSAINFTDSRSIYQFYNLTNLWKDINIALSAGIELWHPAVEPVSAGELYEYLTGETFVNEIMQTPAYYDYKTIHSDTFGGSNGYIMDKESVMKDIKEFVESVVKL